LLLASEGRKGFQGKETAGFVPLGAVTIAVDCCPTWSRPDKLSKQAGTNLLAKSVRISPMPTGQHIEDLQQRYAELKKRIELVRSYL